MKIWLSTEGGREYPKDCALLGRCPVATHKKTPSDSLGNLATPSFLFNSLIVCRADAAQVIVTVVYSDNC